MTVSIAPNFTRRDSRWTEWKPLQQMKRIVYQVDDDGTLYTIWGYDGPEAHVCTIWKGTVPDTVTPVYSQVQNDSDKADFEANWKAGANRTVEQKSTDGSTFTAPCMFPAGVYLYITGADDQGNAFTVASDGDGDTNDTFWFNDWVLIAGGGVLYQGAAIGDHLTLDVYCPATPVTPNVGGTGNCNLVNSVVIVPAAGDGAYDVDLDDANPVLTYLHDGYWEWSFPNIGKGTVSVGEPGKAGAHLIAADYNLIRFVNKATILGEGNFDLTIPAIEPKICLPHWRIKVTVHNGGHTGLKVAWFVTTARVKTI